MRVSAVPTCLGLTQRYAAYTSRSPKPHCVGVNSWNGIRRCFIMLCRNRKWVGRKA